MGILSCFCTDHCKVAGGGGRVWVSLIVDGELFTKPREKPAYKLSFL